MDEINIHSVVLKTYPAHLFVEGLLVEGEAFSQIEDVEIIVCEPKRHIVMSFLLNNQRDLLKRGLEKIFSSP